MSIVTDTELPREGPAQERPAAETVSSGAVIVFTGCQLMRYMAVLCGITLFILWDYKIAFAVLNLMICAFYAAIVGHKCLCVLLSITIRPELKIDPETIRHLPADEWPVYTVLVPLHREERIVAQILDSLARLDYPPEKLDVKILLEEYDLPTRTAVARVTLPPYCSLVVVPRGFPQTKPRACNWGLAQARGRYVVIYDAEDRPDPDQLRKAVTAFRNLPAEVACLQCKLNYYNADQNILTRFFTLEYTVWFDLFLPGLHALDAPIPLGGTSNHFRTDTLRALGGWDPYNVAEDCDLGVRLARIGYKTKVLDSTTWEEANSCLWNWLRQRSRWVKGYIQTHLVHTRTWRDALRFRSVKDHVSFMLTVGGSSLVLLANPVYWLALIVWLARPWRLAYFDFTDATMTQYSFWSKVSWVFCGATAMLIAANFAFIVFNIVACRRRNLWRFLPYACAAPLYWLLMSVGAWRGAAQLLYKPFYWEKTHHGLAPVAKT
jgi:cellulose synthase/poly-beta-1,6-N-acetylglucosamine synthase-like glycosyltransferase